MADEKKRLPYEYAVKAMAYAGVSLGEIKDVLKKAYFALPPKGDGALRSIAAKYRAQARTLHPNFCLSESDIQASEVDPIFTWARTFDDVRKHPDAVFVERMAQKMKNVALRIILDTMIYLDFDDATIAGELPYCYDAPPISMDSDEVAFYRYFFWNNTEMLPVDWRYYYSIMDHNFKLAQNVDRLLNSSRRVAMFEAGLSMESDHIAMGRRVGERCLIEAEKASGSDNQKTKMWLAANKWTDTLLKLKEASSGSSQSATDAMFKELRLISDRDLNTDPVPIDQIEGEVSKDYESSEQLKAVLDAESTRFIGYDAGEKPDAKNKE